MDTRRLKAVKATTTTTTHPAAAKKKLGWLGWLVG
jgi:hypothetical protein